MHLHVPMPLFSIATSFIKGFIRVFQRGFTAKLVLRGKPAASGLIELHYLNKYKSVEGTS